MLGTAVIRLPPSGQIFFLKLEGQIHAQAKEEQDQKEGRADCGEVENYLWRRCGRGRDCDADENGTEET